MALGLDQAIAEKLKAAGFGNLYDESDPVIFIGSEPDTPASTITVFLDGGGEPVNVLAEEWLVTIRVRDPSYETANETMRNIFIALQEEQGNWNGIPVARVRANFSPVPLGRDEGPDSGNYRVTQSYTVLTRRFDYT